MKNRAPLAAVLLVVVGCHGYPARSDVDEFIARWPNEAPSAKVQSARRLLEQLAKTESASDDAVMHYAFVRLADLFDATEDTSLLDAVDAARLEGGFANEACGFYARVSARQKARAQIVATGGKGIERCIGLTLSESEVGALLRR